MSKARLEIDYQGIGKLLRGEEMKQYISEEGRKKAVAAGEGYASRVHDTGQRQAANVYPKTEGAIQDNADRNTLLKTLGIKT